MGFIKIHRNIRDWGWYDDANTLAVWIHLLIDANFEDRVWHGETLGIGSIITSTARLAEQTGLSVKQIRTCLERLSAEGKIVTEGTSKWTKITICNYESYMLEGEDAGQASGEQKANKGQADGKQTATPKEEKKEIKKEGSMTASDAMAAWNTICGGHLPKVAKLTKERAAKARLRLNEMEKAGYTLDAVLHRVIQSDFLRGLKASPGHEGWRADFDWLFKNETNWLKVMEGRYDNDSRSSQSVKATQQQPPTPEYNQSAPTENKVDPELRSYFASLYKK